MKIGLPQEKAEYYNAKGYSLNDRVGHTYLEEYLEGSLTRNKIESENGYK